MQRWRNKLWVTARNTTFGKPIQKRTGLKQAQAIDWVEAPKHALFDRGNGFYEWFSDAKVNTCWNAVDRHVAAGRGDQVAIIHDSPITGTKSKITYFELKDEVSKLAGALAMRGVTLGDRVIIYMPMVSEALIAMLAWCANWRSTFSCVWWVCCQ